jgi:hypothetical protein
MRVIEDNNVVRRTHTLCIDSLDQMPSSIHRGLRVRETAPIRKHRQKRAPESAHSSTSRYRSLCAMSEKPRYRICSFTISPHDRSSCPKWIWSRLTSRLRTHQLECLATHGISETPRNRYYIVVSVLSTFALRFNHDICHPCWFACGLVAVQLSTSH